MFCDLSPRQRLLYRGLRANISVAELLVKASRQGDADSARSLMNLVMQFRKVGSKLGCLMNLVINSYLRSAIIPIFSNERRSSVRTLSRSSRNPIWPARRTSSSTQKFPKIPFLFHFLNYSLTKAFCMVSRAHHRSGLILIFWVP